jgi:hypothetical protein
VRRPLALLTLAAIALAAPALATAKESVKVKPRHGDVNTRFVFHGSGWKPNARLTYTHGAFCAASTACPTLLYLHNFRSDAHGEFTQSIGPMKWPPLDFVGTDVCFGYGPFPDFHCLVSRRIGLTPPSASVTPVHAERNSDYPSPVAMTVAAEHFRAGERLTTHIRFPDGRRRVLHSRARRHGAHVGGANAWAPRGGTIELFTLRAHDPDGVYRVRVEDGRGGEARTSFVASHYAN